MNHDNPTLAFALEAASASKQGIISWSGLADGNRFIIAVIDPPAREALWPRFAEFCETQPFRHKGHDYRLIINGNAPIFMAVDQVIEWGIPYLPIHMAPGTMFITHGRERCIKLCRMVPEIGIPKEEM